jgi:hypothetical protein
MRSLQKVIAIIGFPDASIGAAEVEMFLDWDKN